MPQHEEANPQAEMLQPQGPSAKQIAKEVLAGINPIPHGEAISSLERLGEIRQTIFTTTEGVVLASAAWTNANVAVYMPIVVRHSFPVKQLRIANLATVSGNFDLGIYDSDTDGLPQTRLLSTGSTAQSGANTVQLVDTGTTTLAAGLYYAASVFDNGTATIMAIGVLAHTGFNSGDSPHSLDGVFQEASAFPLPSTATPVVLTGTRRAPLMYVGRHQF